MAEMITKVKKAGSRSGMARSFRVLAALSNEDMLTLRAMNGKEAALSIGVSEITLNREFRYRNMRQSSPVNVSATMIRKKETMDRFIAVQDSKSDVNLGIDFGVSSSTIRKWRARCGLKKDRKKRWEMTPHPRGALGMKHTEATRALLSVASKRAWKKTTPGKLAIRTRKQLATKERNGTMVQERPGASWKAGWRVIGGVRKYYRSRWEANYARYLEWLRVKGNIVSWEHEPKTFWFDGIKRGCVSYLPDFRVVEKNDVEAYHEVKGWMDDKSKTKIRRMKKYHPTVKLIVIAEKQYNEISKKLAAMIPEWEYSLRTDRR